MDRTIAMIGTLDTKGDQIEYLRKKVEAKGHHVVIMDVGVLGEASIEHSITRHQVAEASGMSLAEIAALGPGKESEAMAKMADGAQAVLKDLNDHERIDGVLALGGSMGTALALNVMTVLPLAMPKIVLSTIANSPAINPNFLSHNVLMVPLMGGLWGLNEFSKRSLDQAAGLIVGSTEMYDKRPITEKKLIGVTSLGMSAAQYLYHLRPALKERNFEIAVFHATGMNTRLFEKAVNDRLFDFILDLYAGQELINEICGSLFGPGPHRLEAGAQSGVPQIISLGIFEMCLWGAYKPIPAEFTGRQILHHNPLLWMTFTNLEEKVTMAKILAEKLNQTTGPTAIILPMKPPLGLTKWGLEEREGLEAVRKTLRKNLKSNVNYVEVDASTDDKEFSDWVLELMDHMMN